MEHFNVMGLESIPFKVENNWFTGETNLTTYHFEELIGTKMRALYQRKKGRDLFDLYQSLTLKKIDLDKVLECYHKYITFIAERAPSYKEYVQNMEIKMQDEEFRTDVLLLLHPGISYDAQTAYKVVYNALIDRLPGKRD